MHLSGRIEQIYSHNEMSNEFSVVLITPIGYYITQFFSFIFEVFNNIHEYANEIIFILDHWMKILIITDDIKKLASVVVWGCFRTGICLFMFI